MVTLTTPQISTIGDCLEDESFDVLFDAIEAARPYGCKSIVYVDDNNKPGYHCLVLDCDIVAGHDIDHDGYSPRYEMHRITVKATADMTIDTVVFLLMGEINAIIEA